MGTQTTVDFEGATDGQALTTSNSGLTQVTTNGGSATASASMAQSGSVGARFATVLSPTVAAACQGRVALTSNLVQGISGFLTTPAGTADAAAYSVGVVRPTGATLTCRLVWVETTGTLAIQNSASSDQQTIATGLSPSTRYRVELRLTANATTATDGSLQAAVYLPASSTAIGSVTDATYNLNTSAMTIFDIGCVAAKQDKVVGWDMIRHEDGRTTEWGPLPAVGAPTSNAGADLYLTEGATATLDGTATTPGGGPVYLWTNVEKPPGAANPAIANAAALDTSSPVLTQGRYVFRLRVSQTGGQFAEDDMTVWVHPASNVDALVYSGDGPFSVEGGATSAAAALNDALPATYLLAPSPIPAGGSVEWLVMNPLGADGPVDVRVSGNSIDASVSRLVQVYLENRSTLVDEAPATTLALTPAAETLITLNIDAAGLTIINTIANRRALQIKVTDTPV